MLLDEVECVLVDRDKAEVVAPLEAEDFLTGDTPGLL